MKGGLICQDLMEQDRWEWGQEQAAGEVFALRGLARRMVMARDFTAALAAAEFPGAAAEALPGAVAAAEGGMARSHLPGKAPLFLRRLAPSRKSLCLRISQWPWSRKFKGCAPALTSWRARANKNNHEPARAGWWKLICAMFRKAGARLQSARHERQDRQRRCRVCHEVMEEVRPARVREQAEVWDGAAAREEWAAIVPVQGRKAYAPAPSAAQRLTINQEFPAIKLPAPGAAQSWYGDSSTPTAR